MFFRDLFNPSAKSRLIDAAFNDVSRMLRQSARMLDYALGALLDHRPLEVDLEDMDDVVDEGERMVRRTILQHLAINPQHDLVPSLILLSMVQDAERIGDFARGLVEVSKLARSRREGPFADELRGFADRLRPLFGVCERAFHENDVAEAREVIARYRVLRRDLKQYRVRVTASDLTADMAVVYADAAQVLRRMGAHLANIASTVVQPFDRIRHHDDL
jgi:phosphate uptake regulator